MFQPIRSFIFAAALRVESRLRSGVARWAPIRQLADAGSSSLTI